MTEHSTSKSKEESSKLPLLLKVELDRLITLSCFGQELHVAWVPNGNSNLSGEIRSNLVLIYETEAEKAIDTLRHEFIDYIVSRSIKPYQKVTILYKSIINALIEQIGQEAYEEKELAVEALRKLFSEPHI
jgi:hypothetical protein